MAMTEWSEQAQAVHDYLATQGRTVTVDELLSVFPETKLTAVAHGVYLYYDEKEPIP